MAVDITPDLSPVYLSASQVPSLLKSKKLGLEPHRKKPRPPTPQDVFLTSIGVPEPQAPSPSNLP